MRIIAKKVTNGMELQNYSKENIPPNIKYQNSKLGKPQKKESVYQTPAKITNEKELGLSPIFNLFHSDNISTEGKKDLQELADNLPGNSFYIIADEFSSFLEEGQYCSKTLQKDLNHSKVNLFPEKTPIAKNITDSINIKEEMAVVDNNGHNNDALNYVGYFGDDFATVSSFNLSDVQPLNSNITPQNLIKKKTSKLSKIFTWLRENLIPMFVVYANTSITTLMLPLFFFLTLNQRMDNNRR